MNKIEDVKQSYQELLGVLAEIRESHPEIFRHYVNRLIRLQIKTIVELKP